MIEWGRDMIGSDCIFNFTMNFGGHENVCENVNVNAIKKNTT